MEPVKVIVRFPTLAISRELLGDTVVDYAALSWRPSVDTGLRTLSSKPVEDPEAIFRNPRQVTYDELASKSFDGSYVQISVCPSCMALEAYECAEELSKSTFYCLGSASEEHTISWAARRTDLALLWDVYDWTFSGLLGAAAVALVTSTWRPWTRVPAAPLEDPSSASTPSPRGTSAYRPHDSESAWHLPG
ncbi:hypothetical protein CUD01_29640 [Cellulomonas uda]|uniref:Uncharacterized protein n=1 Tax=Cellulomonas uda TaxID=1714 RepID=A0A4Y3KHU5_CELUD|nr:hypothetical protein CUD01_29640 [Cellulomonas uda]